MFILGIESSCDETAAAIVEDGCVILSSVISSQIDLHSKWGGVVPELASREHLAKIDPVVDEAISRAGIALDQIDAIAVTRGPGLVGSLLVGVTYAKALAFALGKPIIPVNHIEGHFYSVVFENGKIPYPALALIVSGGHTNLFYSPEHGKYKLVSRTRDDAAGEAFDKVSKMLGLGYPGGPIIESVAKIGDPLSIDFPIAKISDGRPDFSFSGLKTAVMRYLRVNDVKSMEKGEAPSREIANICASFQYAVVKSLTRVMKKQAKELQPKSLIVAGGVACNEALRQGVMRISEELSIPVMFPSRHLSTDNAAMIAAAGYFRRDQLETHDFAFAADTSIRLQNLDVEDFSLRKKKVRYRI